ncbi:MAG: PD-(D/E)XK nuclease family protein [Hydrogenophilaceae bacterium]|jgi:hypothetical protein|nr:PD-(D/E)XK nuclease family protein [Hydrogenophilaceae bacterium]
MRWSYSASRSFKKCQRQWFYKNMVASAKARDPVRRRINLLSKLQSVSAWRGRIVDQVISNTVIPGINRGAPVMLREAKAQARALFDRQLLFARNHSIASFDTKPSDHGDDFCLLHGMEYGAPPTDDELNVAWEEIAQALANLYALDAVKAPLKAADHVIAQRALQFDLMDGVTVISYPDAIAFLDDTPPVIVDWKVHAFGDNDAWLQLAIYAIALARSSHNDFPPDFSAKPDEILLLEAQLLTNLVREHRLDAAQIEETEEYMMSSAYEIACLTEGKKYEELNAADFMPAIHPESCQSCAFRAPCWESAHAH